MSGKAFLIKLAVLLRSLNATVVFGKALIDR